MDLHQLISCLMFYVQYFVKDSRKGSFGVKSCVVSANSRSEAFLAVKEVFDGSGLEMFCLMAQPASPAQIRSGKRPIVNQ
jgi:hypothetical protein